MRNNFFTALGSVYLGYPKEFIILVKTDNAGVSASNEILLPIRGTSMVIDWGDGSVSTHTQTLVPTNTIGGANVTHTYTSAGIYRIKISPSINYIRFTNSGDRLKLLEVNNWGKANWTSFEGSFDRCTNADILAKDIPNLTSVTNMSGSFRQTKISVIENMNDWDMSNVTNINAMFFSCSLFNSDISNWNTSKVTSMIQTFNACVNFNQDLSNWDTSNVITFQGLFGVCTQFNSDISGWNTSKAANMSATFQSASSFNQPIGSWDVSNVTNMQQMFQGATNFNQNLGNWNVGKVTNMLAMFRQSGFNNGGSNSIKDWDVSKVINFGELSLAGSAANAMFWRANSFNQPLTNWNTVSARSFYGMFSEATSFNQPLDGLKLHPTLSVIMNTFIGGPTPINAENYSRTLISFANQVFENGNPFAVTMTATSKQYNNTPYTTGLQFNDAVSARAYLVNTAGWTITGDALI
jgi:surface protein